MPEEKGEKSSPFLGLNEAHERECSLEEGGYLQLIADATAKGKEARFTDPEENYWRYEAKPPWVSIVFGAIALTLIVGQMWMEGWNKALGNPIPMIGWWRFCVFVTGGYFAFVAWPHYVHVTGNRRNPPPRLKTRR